VTHVDAVAFNNPGVSATSSERRYNDNVTYEATTVNNSAQAPLSMSNSTQILLCCRKEEGTQCL
jgi:hypothetical protein